MKILLIATSIYSVIATIYLAWSLQGVWDIIKKAHLDIYNQSVQIDREDTASHGN